MHDRSFRLPSSVSHEAVGEGSEAGVTRPHPHSAPTTPRGLGTQTHTHTHTSHRERADRSGDVTWRRAQLQWVSTPFKWLIEEVLCMCVGVL